MAVSGRSVLAALALCAGCGVVFVDSPRTAGLRCTRSKFMPYSDYVIATGLTVGLVAYGGASEAPASLAVPAVFLLSGLWGSHKVNQCRERLAKATPEDWERQRASEQRDAEERARQQQLIEQYQATHPPPPPAQPGAEPLPPAPPSHMTGSKTLTINGTTYTDTADGELGKPCGVDNNTCTSPRYACVLVTSSSGMCAPR